MSAAKTDNILAGEAYLKTWHDHDPEAMAKYLHPQVRFKGPIARMTSREQLLRAAAQMFGVLKALNVTARFSAGDQAIFVYDFVCAEPIGACRTAELMTFENGVITEIELFFDPRPFVAMMAPPPTGG